MPNIELTIVESIDALPLGIQGDSLNQDGILEQWDVIVQYFCKNGVLAVPLGKNQGGTGPTARKVRMHAPVWEKVVEYTITRSGGVPIAPAFETDDANEFLLDYDFKILEHPDSTNTTKGAGHVIRRWGFYKYGLYAPPADPRLIKIPLCVYYPTPGATLKTAHWSKRIINW